MKHDAARMRLYVNNVNYRRAAARKAAAGSPACRHTPSVSLRHRIRSLRHNTGPSPLHYAPLSSESASSVASDASKRSKASTFSKASWGSQVGLVYPTHFTKTCRHLRRPRPVSRSSKMFSTVHSSCSTPSSSGTRTAGGL